MNSPSGHRIATGKKGLGKLAFFGIGETITIVTVKKGSKQKITFTLKWTDIINTHNNDYEPIYEISDNTENEQGTTIQLSDLKRKSSFDLEDIATSISRLFNVFDRNFNVSIRLNDGHPMEIDNTLKYKSIVKEFQWSFPDFGSKVDSKYSLKDRIEGEVLSTAKPLKPGLRGIALFANGRLVNAPEFFGISESSHGYSYFTGWLNVDFVDEWEEDVISTDRQSLNWDLPKTHELREYLKKSMSQLEKDWRAKRNEKRREEIKERTNVDIPNWYDKLPQSILSSVEPIVSSIVDDSELSNDQQMTVVANLHTLIPEYPYFHWRHLHDSIKPVSKSDYENKDYLRAAHEAVKKYIKETQSTAQSDRDGFDLMMNVFGIKGPLKITGCTTKSEEDLEEGQKFLSAGVVSGFRNPVSHETKDAIHPKIFNDQDCLDILSLLSYLFGKLDATRATTVATPTK